MTPSDKRPPERPGGEFPGVVTLVTTSYPVPGHPSSGSFVASLAEALRARTPTQVIAPAGLGEGKAPDGLTLVRYAPRHWQRLAHGPGGLPAALDHPWAWLLLPGFLLTLFVASLRAARRARVLIGNWSLAALAAGLAGRIAGRPVICVLRGSDVNRALSSRPARWMLVRAAGLATRLVTVSPELAQALNTVPGLENADCEVIGNGVASEFFQLPPPEKEGNPLRLLMLGNLTAGKRPGDLLLAVSRLQGPHRVVVDFVGDGPARAPLQRQAASLGVEARFPGRQAHAEIPRRMAACHVLVSASEAEGRSNAVLEGLAAGRVCVASDASGVSDLARQLPQLYEFRTGDVDALTGCLQRLLDHWPAEAQGAEQQRETVRRLIPDWDHCAGRYLDLLRSLPDAH